MKHLNTLDAAFLSLETPETPMNVGSLHLYDLPPGYRGNFFQKVKRQVAQRMPLVPVLRRKLKAVPLRLANPVWVADDEVDLDFHVRHVGLSPPGRMAQLEGCVAGLHATLLDQSRPLWEFYVIDGLASGQVAFYAKLHHAALDGAAGLALVTALLDTTPQPRMTGAGAQRLAHEKEPGVAELVGDAIKTNLAQYGGLARSLPVAARSAVRGKLPKDWAFGPKTPLNGNISGERAFATLSVPLQEALDLAHRMNVTLNDVVLAACSGGLRCYLEHHGGVPKKPLMAAVPVSLRQSGNTEMNTQAMLTLASLATHLADPVKRLLAIHQSCAAAKQFSNGIAGPTLTDFPSIGIPWLLSALAAIYGWSKLANIVPPIANVIISNVHGPQVPLYLAGARMATYWPLSIPIHGAALNITVESYCDSLYFGLIACRRTVPDLHDLATYVADAYQELKKAVHARKVNADEAKGSGKARDPKAKKPATAGRAVAGIARKRKVAMQPPAALATSVAHAREDAAGQTGKVRARAPKLA